MKQIFELLEKGFEVSFRRDSYDETFRFTLSKQTEQKEIFQANFRFSYQALKHNSDIMKCEVEEMEKHINREIYKRKLEIKSSQNPS